jgi:hypothetical protein
MLYLINLSNHSVMIKVITKFLIHHLKTIPLLYDVPSLHFWILTDVFFLITLNFIYIFKFKY